jgi:hypothetical protein
MRPRLKEDPREWRKFTGASLAALWILTGLLWHRDALPLRSLQAVAILSGFIALVAGFRPRALRVFYRLAMTLGFHLGQGIGRLLLALIFLLVVAPLGLALRLSGRDLLHLRRGPKDSSYWQPARSISPLDRQF